MHGLRKSLIPVAVIGALALAACSEQAPEQVLTTTIYETRGLVRAMPDAKGEMQISHEEIPEFRGFNGQLGMPKMLMPFPVGDVSLEDIEVGDKVALAFEVEYDEVIDGPTREYWLVRIEELDPETELDLVSND